jgi:hypothetical protein
MRLDLGQVRDPQAVWGRRSEAVLHQVGEPVVVFGGAKQALPL